MTGPDSGVASMETARAVSNLKTPELHDIKNFTPLPEFGKPTMTEPPKYEEPTTISPQDKILTEQLMVKIMDKPEPKKADEVISHIKKNIPQEKKSQGFWAQIIERFKTTFRNLFR